MTITETRQPTLVGAWRTHLAEAAEAAYDYELLVDRVAQAEALARIRRHCMRMESEGTPNHLAELLSRATTVIYSDSSDEVALSLAIGVLQHVNGRK